MYIYIYNTDTTTTTTNTTTNTTTTNDNNDNQDTNNTRVDKAQAGSAVDMGMLAHVLAERDHEVRASLYYVMLGYYTITYYNI